MYHLSSDPLSTGEPPTPPLESRVPLLPILRTSSDQARSLTAQEQDSGYEASPSATNSASSGQHFFGSSSNSSGQRFFGSNSRQHFFGSNSRQHFFGSDQSCSTDMDQTAIVEPETDDFSLMADHDDVFEEESFVLLEREEDWCRECNATTTCTCRAGSSATVRSTADPSTCDISHSSSDLSSQMRPSSLPIRIPTMESIAPVVPVTNCPCSPRLQPSLSGSRPQTPVVRFHPRTWPTSIMSRWNQCSPTAIISAMMQSGFNRPIPRQGRWRLVDIEATDVNLSDESDSDAVNSPLLDVMGEDDSPLRVGSPMDPLPDIILHSSPSNIRRNRSASVSLPLEDDIFRHIGRSLRRLSDQFEMERGIHRTSCGRRRGTMDNNFYSRPS